MTAGNHRRPRFPWMPARAWWRIRDGAWVAALLVSGCAATPGRTQATLQPLIVARAGSDGFHSYRTPALAVAADGNVWATWLTQDEQVQRLMIGRWDAALARGKVKACGKVRAGRRRGAIGGPDHAALAHMRDALNELASSVVLLRRHVRDVELQVEAETPARSFACPACGAAEVAWAGGNELFIESLSCAHVTRRRE